MIYLDNAASTWPKPPAVVEAMSEVMQHYAANPGRGSHQLSLQASRVIYKTRKQVADLFGVHRPEDVAFTQNATESLNLAIKGFLKPGDHVISTMIEHNSIRRPLEYMRTLGVDVTYIKVDPIKGLDLTELKNSIQKNTTLIAVNHASNVTGLILPIEEIGQIAKKNQLRMLVDASQTAGFYPIDVIEMNVDLLAFTGHKALYGPQGTGGLYINPDIELVPLMHGGTGGYSELIEQPPTRPDRYESGTRNTVGIAGLGAGIDYVVSRGIEHIRLHEERLTKQLLDSLNEMKGITVFGPSSKYRRAPVVSFLVEGFDSTEIGFIFDKEYNIAVRTGLHCSPLAHETYGSTETGAIRASIGSFNTEEQIDQFISALQDLVSV